MRVHVIEPQLQYLKMASMSIALQLNPWVLGACMKLMEHIDAPWRMNPTDEVTPTYLSYSVTLWTKTIWLRISI